MLNYIEADKKKLVSVFSNPMFKNIHKYFKNNLLHEKILFIDFKAIKSSSYIFGGFVSVLKH